MCWFVLELLQGAEAGQGQPAGDGQAHCYKLVDFGSAAGVDPALAPEGMMASAAELRVGACALPYRSLEMHTAQETPPTFGPSASLCSSSSHVCVPSRGRPTPAGPLPSRATSGPAGA